MAELPLVAIVGRPNVGKSTLFNRLVGGRRALVHDTPGVTRDRRYGEAEYFGARFRVVDTGGLDPDAAREVIGAGVHRQAAVAIAEADLILLVIDAEAGLTPRDREVAVMLRKTGRPLLCVANKVDAPRRDAWVGELYELGLGDVFPVSAEHGRGVDDLVEAVVARLPRTVSTVPAAETLAEPTQPLRVAFVGKPNAGKSSLVNRLLGVDRTLVHDKPGTTTDPIDTPFELGGRAYVLVDTAGVRRKARVEADTERIAQVMALSQLRTADVVVLVVDAASGVSEQDARIAAIIAESGRAVVVALNKADLLRNPAALTAARRAVADELRFLAFAPVAPVSALRGDGVGALMQAVDRAAVEHRRRIPTAELNRFFAEVCETHPPPAQSGRLVHIHYITQGGVKPPAFLLFANRPELVSEAYRRFLINQLRERYGFQGTPLRVFVRAKGAKEAKGPRGAKRKGSRKSRA